MPLSENQKRQLRKLGHSLNPVVRIGNNGLTESVCVEAENAIDHHELIKIKITGAERAQRDAIIAELCSHCRAELIQRIGNVALLFRRNAQKSKIILS